MGLIEYLMGKEEPFWMQRAKGETNSPLVNEMYLEDKRGNPQTIYSATAPLGDASRTREPRIGVMYPTIRYREPQKNEYKETIPYLERLLPPQAYRETMQKQDYIKFPTLLNANNFARNFSPTIKRKKRNSN
tara:strand:- start:329 stop:724 length:396 start_codon:yes stop_codon:yes gene_type:complete